MDLWIRSQDKMSLSKCDKLVIGSSKTHLLTNTDNLYHILSYTDSTKYIDLGKYTTKERALEILNDIEFNVLTESLQENNISYESADIKLKNIIANNMIKIYNMPKE